MAYLEEVLPHSVAHPNFKSRYIHLWMLGFDKASKIKLTNNNVDKKIVAAYLGINPYHPRPDVDEKLWNDFCGTYLEAGKLILENRMEEGPMEEGPVMDLPQRFPDKVIEKIQMHEDWDPENNILFED